MTLNRWDPFRDLLSFQEKMNRLMDTVAGPVGRPLRPSWDPDVDVVETPDAYIFRVDLPGVGKDRINIEIRGDRLTIEGERRTEAEPFIAAYHTIERETGHFLRSFVLPGNVDVEQAHAEYVDGVLNLVLPKSDEARQRSITVVCLG